MANEAALFCKSFSEDFDHLAVMLRSFEACNTDKTCLTISLPESDIDLFKSRFGSEIANILLVSDESYCDKDAFNLRGWYAQQVCKMQSWKVMNAKHYAVLDSDCYFIRPFSASEFAPKQKQALCCGSTIRTVLKKDNSDLVNYIDGTLVPGQYHFPEKNLNPLRDNFDKYLYYKDLNLDSPNAIDRSDIPFKVFNAKKWFFFQPGQIFTAKILESFGVFLEDRSASVIDAIKMSPWEYNWYGEFAAAYHFEETEFCISPFLHIQSEDDVIFARENSYTESKLSHKFPIVAMAARHVQTLKLE